MSDLNSLLHDITNLSDKDKAQQLNTANETLAKAKFEAMRAAFQKCCDEYVPVYQALHAAGEFDADVAFFVFETGGSKYRITVEKKHVKACGYIAGNDFTCFYSTRKKDLRENKRYFRAHTYSSDRFIQSCQPENIYPDFTAAVETFLTAIRDKKAAKHDEAMKNHDDLRGNSN